MKIAITGGSGQIGTHVLRRLIDDRRVTRIVAVDRLPPSLISSKLTVIEGDVRDPEIGRHFEGCEVLIHLAFIITTKVPRATFDAINIEGSKNVFRAAQKAGVRQIVYTSSLAAYGVLPGHPVPIVEDSPRRHQPEFPYSAAKYVVEEFLDAFEKEQPELLVVRLRPSVVVGTRFGNPLGKLFGMSLDRGVMVSAGDVVMPLVWDEDVADFVMLAIEEKQHGAFNLTADEPQSARALGTAVGLKVFSAPDFLLRLSSLLSPLAQKLGAGEAIDPTWQDQARVDMIPSAAKAVAAGWKRRANTSLEVVQRYLAEAPGAVDRRVATALRLAGLGTKKDDHALAGFKTRIHLALTGKGGGDFAIVAEDGKLSVSRGIPRPPTSIATLGADTFLELVAGKINVSSAQMVGKIRVEGDPGAMWILGGLSTRMAAQARGAGLRGGVARALTRWFGGAG